MYVPGVLITQLLCRRCEGDWISDLSGGTQEGRAFANAGGGGGNKPDAKAKNYSDKAEEGGRGGGGKCGENYDDDDDDSDDYDTPSSPSSSSSRTARDQALNTSTSTATTPSSSTSPPPATRSPSRRLATPAVSRKQLLEAAARIGDGTNKNGGSGSGGGSASAKKTTTTPPSHYYSEAYATDYGLGQVHPILNLEGVGINPFFRRLPDWNRYITYTDGSTIFEAAMKNSWLSQLAAPSSSSSSSPRAPRPAIGSVTIQILEALSLPPVDVHGKADPYCVVTLTGRSVDPLLPGLQYREWDSSSAVSLETGYVSSTLCPVWRGGVCTLPVKISADAFVRVRVYDYEALPGVEHTLLGICEIPLADLPNDYKASRESGEVFYVEGWYELQSGLGWREGVSIPKATLLAEEEEVDEEATSPVKTAGSNTAKELFGYIQGALREPLVLIAKVAKINLQTHRVHSSQYIKKPRIHLRIRLSISEFGDLFCHAWTLPTRARKTPKFDPNRSIARVKRLQNQLSPYIETIGNFVGCLRWKSGEGGEGGNDAAEQQQSRRRSFSVVMSRQSLRYTMNLVILCLHICVGLRATVFLVHLYGLFHLLKVRDVNTSSVDSTRHESAHGNEGISAGGGGGGGGGTPGSVRKGVAIMKDQTPTSKGGVGGGGGSGEDHRHGTAAHSDLGMHGGGGDDGNGHTAVAATLPNRSAHEEALRVNTVINWVGRQIGNEGLDHFQLTIKDAIDQIEDLESAFDGRNMNKTRAAIAGLSLSTVLIALVGDLRIVAFVYSILVLFVLSPMFPVFMRLALGLVAGVHQVTRRKRIAAAITAEKDAKIKARELNKKLRKANR